MISQKLITLTKEDAITRISRAMEEIKQDKLKMYLLQDKSPEMAFYFERSYNNEGVGKREFYEQESLNNQNSCIWKRKSQRKVCQPPMKNFIKNIIVTFRSFCSFLSRKQVDEIVEFGQTFDINLQKSADTNKQHYLIDLLNKAILFEYKANNGTYKKQQRWNYIVIDRIRKNPILKAVIIFWLDKIADFWIYKFSKMSNDKTKVRQILKEMSRSFKEDRRPKIRSSFYQKETVSQNPPLPIHIINFQEVGRFHYLYRSPIANASRMAIEKQPQYTLFNQSATLFQDSRLELPILYNRDGKNVLDFLKQNNLESNTMLKSP